MTLNKPTSRLFVGSLPYKFTEGQLLSLFAQFGRIISIQIAHNQWGKSRGLGFVEFDNIDSAIQAQRHLHNHPLGDRTIIVDFASPDPFLTPEGQERHQQAVDRRHPKRRPPSSTANPNHQRQSVYDSRRHGARVGRKFSRETRSKSRK